MGIDCSIVIPTYNSGKRIEKCLGSIFLTDHVIENIEVIVVDDGSTDNTYSILEKWKKEHPSIVILYKKNGGVSSARNVGIEHASGEYIFFADADDEICIDVLKEMIEQSKKTPVDLIIADMEQIGINCSVKYISSQLADGILNRRYIEDNIFTRYVKGENSGLASVCNKLFLLSVIKDAKLSFDENRTHGEDWAFCVKYFDNITTCMAIHKSVYRYVLDGTQHYEKYSKKLSYCLIDGHVLMEKLNEKYKCIERGSEDYLRFKRRFLNQIIRYLDLDNCCVQEKREFLRTKEVCVCMRYLRTLDRNELRILGLSRRDKIAFRLLERGFFKVPLKILLR